MSDAGGDDLPLIVLRFPEASGYPSECNHAALVMIDGDCGSIQCEDCHKRWCSEDAQSVASIKTKKCNPRWLVAIKKALRWRRSTAKRMKGW